MLHVSFIDRMVRLQAEVYFSGYHNSTGLLAKSIRGELMCYTEGGLLYHCSVVPSAIHTASRKEGNLKIPLCCQRLHRILHGSKLDFSKHVNQVKNNMKGNRIRVQLERLTPHFEIITTSLVRFIAPLFQCSVRTPRSLTFLRENLRSHLCCSFHCCAIWQHASHVISLGLFHTYVILRLARIEY